MRVVTIHGGLLNTFDCIVTWDSIPAYIAGIYIKYETDLKFYEVKGLFTISEPRDCDRNVLIFKNVIHD